jgi:hypothetical protein
MPEKKQSWNEDSARAWLSKNKHQVGKKEVKLGEHAGIKAFGVADYLRYNHGYNVIYYKKL